MDVFPEIPEWVQLETRVAQILTEQELHGWYFDKNAAWQLASTLRSELEGITELLLNRHPFVPGETFTPKRSNRTKGYVAGAEFLKLKDLNPTSRDHIAWILEEKYGWNPTIYTATGKPVIDEPILKDCVTNGIEIAQQFLRMLEITKSLGMISEGANAWLKLCTKSNRIHHHCSVATNTHRCAHRHPNLAQTPSDENFRKLFRASPGLTMVGADLSGIELRMLAHYLGRYDEGRYADILLNGDIHQVNADKIGVSRKLVKTITYAFLYGAGDVKIGHSYDKQLSTSKAQKKGKEIRAAYIDAIPGLAELLKAITKAADRGFVRSIDRRKILVDSPHKALNYCLQSGAGTIAKRWMVIANDTVKQCKLEAHQLAFVHDELQYESHHHHVDDLKFALEMSAAVAGEYYNLRIPIAAEAGSGPTWNDTH